MADWLEQRLQLGRDVFGRGVAEPDAGSLPAADVTALLRACLKLLALPERERVYRPNPPLLWRVPEALDRMRRLLPHLLDGAPLGRFLPPVGEGPAATLQRRAALLDLGHHRTRLPVQGSALHPPRSAPCRRQTISAGVQVRSGPRPGHTCHPSRRH
ncbi:hypothetical protein [Siccirubricoccus deserti]|uniref:Uncharacterized protein n=1 Tax=Siccirubricoccus deserti TaxID=2013562 RepID=A0A9X0UGI1_9PROT|nr:hypothetical protein [Siccirubricoccus deserti]MBC4018943.1 hypothetical protein [Siccirubricoccus deserti]